MTSLMLCSLERNYSNELNLQYRNRLSDLENKLVVLGKDGSVEGMEGIVMEFEMDMYTRLYLKWITSKDLLYSTWNSAQYYLAAWMRGKFGREWIHVYVWPSPFPVH